MLKSCYKDETAVHCCYCCSDMAAEHICKVLSMEWSCFLLRPFENVIDKLCFTKEFNYFIREKINKGTFNSF